MYLVSSIINRLYKIGLLSTMLIGCLQVIGQDNSPYSRYGLGDLVPNQNIANRGMGGISIGYADYGLLGTPFNINTINPASLGNISNTKNFSNTIFDIGSEVDFRTLKSNTSAAKFSAKNAVISYMQIAFPVSTKKMERKGTFWGVNLGLRPISRINYKIQQNYRDNNTDSLLTVYEGSGGLNQINLSTGIKKTGNGKRKNEVAFGLSSGINFGTKDYSTKIGFINDTVQYYRSNYEVKSRFYGSFLNLGLQYKMHFINAGILRVGAIANFQQHLIAKQNTINETFGYDYNGGEVRIDSVQYTNDVKGTVIFPSSYGFGFTYQSKNKQWLLGADYELTNWNSYKYYGNQENTHNNWTIRLGAEYYPAKSNGVNKKFSDYIKYRTGFYFGPDYIILNGNKRDNFAFTGGFSLPLTTPRYIQSRGEYVTLSTSFEIGSKTNNQSNSIKENYSRINIGVSMNARWFQKRSYD